MTTPQISPLPQAPRRTDAPSDFSLKADAFLGALPTFGEEANTMSSFLAERADSADQSAVTASEKAADALASQQSAASSAAAAASSASSSQQSATAAEQSAATAVAAKDAAVQAAVVATATAEEIEQKLASIAEGPVASVLGLGGVVTLEQLAQEGLATDAALQSEAQARQSADENLQQQVSNKASLTGTETLTNKTLEAPVIKDAARVSAAAYIDKTVVVPAATGTVTLDLSLADVFDITLAGNATVALSNIPTLSGETFTFVVRITQGATARTLTWFSGISWLTLGGAAPSAPSAKKSAEYIFSTTGGANWIGRKGAAN